MQVNKLINVLGVVTVIMFAFLIFGCVAGVEGKRSGPDLNKGDTQALCEIEIPDSDEDILTINGERLKIIDFDRYTCQKGQWVYKDTLLRDGFTKYIKIERTNDNCIATDIRTGTRYPLLTNFSTGFEVPKFLDLFHEKGWTITTLLSPSAKTVKKYMDLNRSILAGGKFLDNRIDLETDNVHSGTKALRFYSTDPGFFMRKVKSLIEKQGLCFGKGDHLWFSGWYYFDSAVPWTVVDFEDSRLRNGPGIQIFILKGKYATLQLKYANMPKYIQSTVEIPRQKWVNLKLHLVLSNHDDGVIEMWQDGELILSTTGQTLPTHKTIYNRMQVGITVTPRETTLIVDDIVLSNKPK